MPKNIARAIALASLFVLAGCGTAPFKPLPTDVRDKLVSTDVAMPIRQNEIYVYVPPSSAGGTAGAAFGMAGALLGAIIDVSVNQSRTEKAEAAVKPLREALVGFEADPLLRDDLKASLAKVDFLHVADVKLVKDFGVDVGDTALATTPSAALLFAAVDYRLDNDGNVLQVMVRTSLFLKAGTKPVKTGSVVNTKLENAVYRDVIFYKTKLPGATDKRDANIALWAADGGAPLKAALKDASAKLAAIIADDIARTGAEPSGKDVKVDGMTGQIVSSDEQGTLIRIKDGGLHYVTKAILQP